MSWQSTHDRVINFVCKVSPKSKMCLNHLMAKYPECFKSSKSYIGLLLDMPQKLWKRLVSSSTMTALDPGVCPICQEEEQQDTAILTIAFKIIFLLAASVAILYAILKATANRRPSAQ